MKRRDIVIAAVILLVTVGVVVWNRSRQPAEELVVPETLSDTVEEVLEEKFNIQIPEDVDKAELKDVSGGNASGIATHKFENNSFAFTLVADLPEVEKGGFYKAWLEKGSEGSEDFSRISVGQPSLTKGGWNLSYESRTDYSDYSKVVVSQETRAGDSPDKKILEGNF